MVLRGRTVAAAACLVLGGALVFVSTGCQREPHAATGSCDADADCASGEHCETSQDPARRPLIALPCPTGLTPCTADTDCASGEVCNPATIDGKTDCGKACKPGCPSIPCAGLQVCENARCRALRCDEPGGPTCAERWRCDPPAAATEPVGNQGSQEGDGALTSNAIAAGCVRIDCSEPNGFTCSAGWECDPENTTDGSGCRALPCAEAGVCLDGSYICTPTSTNRRPLGMDPHGCVPRNCEEGAECILFNVTTGENVAYCDFSGPFSDTLGCATRPCESDAECMSYEVCDPESLSHGRYGCRTRTCTEGGAMCPLGWHCDPSATSPTGCVVDGSGGSGGSGGSAGGSGGTSGSATGGAAGDANGTPGRCVSD